MQEEEINVEMGKCEGVKMEWDYRIVRIGKTGIVLQEQWKNGSLELYRRTALLRKERRRR